MENEQLCRICNFGYGNLATVPLVIKLVLNSPGITLHEIKEELLHTLLIQIDVANICRLLQQNGFTRQKLKICALWQSKFLR